MEQQLALKAVARAASIHGADHLCARLGCKAGELRAWLDGVANVPTAVFLVCVDVITEHEAANLRRDSEPGTPDEPAKG